MVDVGEATLLNAKRPVCLDEAKHSGRHRCQPALRNAESEAFEQDHAQSSLPFGKMAGCLDSNHTR